MSFPREPDEEPIPGYRLIKPLGSGGFGEVWLCEAPGEILKAIKFVFGNLDASASGDGRARQEYHALQRVKEVRHPFVLSIERIDIMDDGVAIVMELAEKNLYDVYQEAREQNLAGIPREKMLRYIADAAEGLDYLSETHNLMHLDVKPRNLFVVGDHVKVADFGLAKHLERQSSSGILAGISPQYSPPETFTSRITKASDQYSLAIVYAEMLTGRRPFNGKTIRELAMQHMNNDPDLSALPERDRRVVGRALSKDPTKRFPNCKAFVEALGTGSGTTALPVDAPSSAPWLTPGMSGRMTKVTDDDDDILKNTAPTRLVAAPPSGLIETTGVPLAQFEKSSRVPPSAPKISDSHWLPRLGDSQRIDFDFPSSATGALRPTLIIGMGGFGLLALRELRSRLTDRLGDLRQIPLIRFLYIDTDPESKVNGTAGSPDRALQSDQIFPTLLQPMTRYRRSAMDLLNEWLPREKMLSIPRTLQPQGSRALGRLAFTENYLRYVTRVRREIEIATHPESVSRSADHSGMPVRDQRPRVFVLAAAGGSSSGALPDIGYATRKLLEQMKQPISVTGFLFLGSPADPTNPEEEVANVYATLTELNHYADDQITFQAKYGGVDGPKVESPGGPFDAVYLLQRGGRGPLAGHECAERLASYLCLDLTSPLGAELDRVREANSGQQFRSFGTGGVWFPRGLLLRSAARLACENLIQTWQSNSSSIPEGVREFCQQQVNEPGLKLERLVEKINSMVQQGGENAPTELIKQAIKKLERSFPTTPGEGARWAKESFDAMISLVGTREAHEPTEGIRSGRLSKIYSNAVSLIGDGLVRKIGNEAMNLLEQPGKRIATTEAALTELSDHFVQVETAAHHKAQEFVRQSELAYASAKAAIDACIHGGGFTFFGNKEVKNMRALLAALTNYAWKRSEEEAYLSVSRIYRRLKGGLDDRQRDLAICRQRLTHLRQALEIPETAGAFIRSGASQTVELLLPDGGHEIEWAAKQFVESIRGPELTKLDRTLQGLVLEGRGGLYAACQKSGEVIQELADPIIDQAAAFLGTLLPFNDVSDFTDSQGSNDWRPRLRRAFDRATPTVPGLPDHELLYLMVPDTAAGEQISRSASEEFPGTIVQQAPRSNEITFCREVKLRPQDVRATMQYCRDPYENRASRPPVSPHSRFDVVEWVPLDI